MYNIFKFLLRTKEKKREKKGENFVETETGNVRGYYQEANPLTGTREIYSLGIENSSL